MKKIGIVGAGQAGQRIAVALNEFEDVSVTGIVDPVNGKDVLSSPDSNWFIQDATFFDDDDQMLSQGYDGIIMAADPINIAHPNVVRYKMAILASNNISAPILWERPLCFKPEHPNLALGCPKRYKTFLNFWI